MGNTETAEWFLSLLVSKAPVGVERSPPHSPAHTPGHMDLKVACLLEGPLDSAPVVGLLIIYDQSRIQQSYSASDCCSLVIKQVRNV